MREMRVRLLPPTVFRRTPWKNGGGVTVDIAGAYRPGAAVAGWDGMLWRFGHTRIERPGPFSDLAGFDRILAVIEGHGLVLHPTGAAAIDVRQVHRPVRFPGEWAIDSMLEAGPVGVLNLMADRREFDIALSFERGRAELGGSMSVCHILYALEGGTQLDVGVYRHDIPPGHALRVDWSEAQTGHLTAAGIVAVATIAPHGHGKLTAE